jgi:hypothetical protein
LDFIRKKGGAHVLREEWHVTEDGGKLLLLKFPLLEATGLVKHCFTTRLGGVSEGMFATMNLGLARSDDRIAVETNYRRLAKALEVDYEKFVLTDQTHTVHVRRVTAADAGKGLTRERDYRNVDGLITDVPGLVLSTFFADCVPLYFVDPVHRAIGMSHSGWRGTVRRMGSATIEAMRQAYGSRPEDLVCAIGPSICQDCYEVGEDVAEEVRRAFPGREAQLLREERGLPEPKYRLDLWRANELVMLDAGVRQDHIAVTDICTCCNPQLLFSHRASHGRRGNLGGFLSLCENS